MYRGHMHACFKLDTEQARSQAFQWGGYLGGEGGTTGESRNVGGGPGVQKPLENPGKWKIWTG